MDEKYISGIRRPLKVLGRNLDTGSPTTRSSMS